MINRRLFIGYAATSAFIGSCFGRPVRRRKYHIAINKIGPNAFVMAEKEAVEAFADFLGVGHDKIAGTVSVDPLSFGTPGTEKSFRFDTNDTKIHETIKSAVDFEIDLHILMTDGQWQDMHDEFERIATRMNSMPLDLVSPRLYAGW